MATAKTTSKEFSTKDATKKLKDAAKTAKKTAEDLKDEFKNLNSNEMVQKVKDIIKEGNARRIIIKNEDGKSIMEFPVTVGVVGALFAPYLAAVGALAAVLTSCSIVVEKKAK